jgi:hypothetical protein
MALTDANQWIVKVPSKTIISAYHIQSKKFGHCTFQDVFNLAPELFDPKFPLEPSVEIPSKKVNCYGEYF